MTETIQKLRVFDADNHYYEPLDAFTRYLDPAHGPRVCQIAEIDGRKYHVLAGKIDRTTNNPTFDPIAKPGALYEWFRGNPGRRTVKDYLREREPIRLEYRNPDARLAAINAQGVERVWLFPTLGMMYEHRLRHDPEGVALLFGAFNKWLADDWGFNRNDRIFAAPYISLAMLGDSVKTLEWALDRGARVLVMRPAATMTPDGPQQPADPVFDPFWARVAEAGITVVVHAGNSGYNFHDYSPQDRVALDSSDATNWGWLHQERPIFDFLAALLYDRLFERFPTVRIASIENGCGFLPELHTKIKALMNKAPGHFKEDPLDLFHRQVWINPFFEDNLHDLLEIMGPDRVIFGSDWPHVEGLVTPLDYLEDTKALEPSVRHKVLYDNARGLNTLQPV